MIREAVKRESHVSERERLYIDAMAAGVLPDPLLDKPDADNREARATTRRRTSSKRCA